MRPILAFVLVAGLCASPGSVLADGAPAGANSANAFAGSAAALHGPHALDPEDLANPFVEAHPIEQALYINQYYAHYHLVPDIASAPAQPPPPSAVDPQGRPLWFDRPNGDRNLENLVMRLAARSQFDDLDRLFNDWSKPSERMADGRWKLLTFSSGIEGLFARARDWDVALALVKDWRKKSPKSIAAALAEAIYWQDYAWDARGVGFSDTVTSEGWRFYRERLDKAEAVMIESKPYAEDNPLWARLQIEIGMDLDWPKTDLFAIFAQSATKHRYFYPIYHSMANVLTPKWGGDWRLVDRFIREAVKNTQAVDGYSMYARLYWSVSSCNCFKSDLFHETLADWPDMKRGFKDLLVRYPHSAWLVNTYAAYACVANDRDTFETLRLRIGKIVTYGAWPSNHSLDLCEHTFPAQPL